MARSDRDIHGRLLDLFSLPETGSESLNKQDSKKILT